MNGKRLNKLFSVMLLNLALLLFAPLSAEAASKLKIHYIDVGQGDAILWQYGSDSLLIDSGTEKEYPKLKSYLKKAGVTKINSLIVTHPDADHMGASDYVIEDYGVKKIYMTNYSSSTIEYQELLNAISANHVQRINVKKGSKIPIGSLKAKVLSADVNAEDSNDSSVVTLLTLKKHKFLFTGDASAELENKINAENNLSNMLALKVAHHGSGYSSPISYIKKMSPKASIISVGATNERTTKMIQT